MKRPVVFRALCRVGKGVGLYFLDAMLAFRGQKTRSLINCDSTLIFNRKRSGTADFILTVKAFLTQPSSWILFQS